MADVRAPLRVLDELLWSLRRAGFTIATSQAIDAFRAASEVGFASQNALRSALATVIVKRSDDRQRFGTAFDAFFARTPRRTLEEELLGEGFREEEIAEVLAIAAELLEGSPWLEGGAALEGLLVSSSSRRLLEAMQSPLQAGYFGHRLVDVLGGTRALDALAALRLELAERIGSERADVLVAALRRRIDASFEDVRGFVRDAEQRRSVDRFDASATMGKPFAELDERELEDVRRAVRGFVERLRGGERVRRRRARRGRIDPRATLRAAMRTDAVPFALARRARRRDKPKLMILCDVSESVRGVSAFFLELTYAAQDLFSGTRSFVFVSELGETTRTFEEENAATALGRVAAGQVVPLTHNSNYGRVLRAFARGPLRDVDRRTTVVLLGDGRTNYQGASSEVLDKIRERARALVWLCSEPRKAWAVGDSAMAEYARKCTHVLEVRSARDLEDAARLLLRLRS